MSYVIDSKVLANALTRCASVISLGQKAESNSISFVFSKTGLTIETHNSFSSYRSELPVEVQKPTKFRCSLLPDLLLSYTRAHKTLTLIPKEDMLGIKGTGNFTAQLYYLSAADSFEADPPQQGIDISRIAAVVQNILPNLSAIRNRTNRDPLGVMLSWAEGKLEVVVGDSHHVALAESKIKQTDSGKLVMTLANLQKIVDIGSNFVATDRQFIAWSDTDYLSLANQTEDVFLANSVADAFKKSKSAVVTIAANRFKDLLSSLTDAVEESSVLTFEASAERFAAAISTNAGKANASIKPTTFKGSKQSITVNVGHLRDCIATVKSEELRLDIYPNMLVLVNGKGIVYKAAMSASAGK